DASAPARALSSDHLLELAPEDAPADGLRLHNASTSAPAYAMIAFEGVPVAPPPTHSNALFTLARTFALADGTPYDPATDPPLPAGTIFLQTLVVAPTPAARAQDAVLDQLVLSALLPAGWEIENPTLSTSQRVAYKPPVPAGPEIHREVRDDRLLVFTGHLWGNAPVSYVVTLRATIPGTYVLPPATVSAMYAPGLAADTPPDPLAITVVPAPVACKDASPAPSLPPTPPPVTPPGDVPAPDVDSLFYQVNPGDTIDLLAQLFGISADDIRRVNHFAPNTDVTPGQKIVIPPATD
ncbi:MAG: LysM peptidoglycan-binding domain-containing protein, partial [Kiritimatiellae bacterium]|nr:LysM peptidoglycan-binding domain-containing protein [Kiritimatiellia bacterium]